MDYLSIGQMAERNCVTKKTLRLYHEKGLLEPAHIDSENGRRYYTKEQCYQLDFIQRMQAIGMPLTKIEQLLNSQDDLELERAVREQSERLEVERRVLSTACESARELIAGMRLRKATVSLADTLPQPTLAQFDAVDALVVPCTELGIEPHMSVHDCGDTWYRVMASVKRYLLALMEKEEVNIPVPLVFKKVGLVYSRERFRSNSQLFDKVFIVLNSDMVDVLGNCQTLPAGEYLTVSGECLSLLGFCSGRCVPSLYARRLFACAEEHGLQSASECYVETLVDPISLRGGTPETLFRVRLQILG